MKSKQDILNTKNWNEEYPNYMAESEIENAMDEFGEEIAIDFTEWMGVNGYRPYDGRERWISLPSAHVYCTKELFERYLKDKGL